MNQNNLKSDSELDNIIKNGGHEECRLAFRDVYKRSRREAVALLNDHRLSFPYLYLLITQIASYQLSSRLNLRGRTALGIVNQIHKPAKSAGTAGMLSGKNGTVYSALLWMFQTGYDAEIQNDEYEEILDITVSVLINVYQDVSILPQAAELIFKRNRAGRNIHDLLWAYMRIRDPYALKLIAGRLHSPDERDVAFAGNLLSLPDTAGITADTAEAYLNWLSDNDPFLYFTDNSRQYASSPALYDIDLERKYLQKGTPSYSRQPLTPEDDEESKCLEVFRSFEKEEKLLLAEFSHKKHSESPEDWKNWMKRPADDQIAVAKTEQGVARWL